MSLLLTSEGQYHWVSEFAPDQCQKSLSYLVGWMCVLGWVAGVPSCCEQLAGLVQTMVLLVYPNANVNTLWQTTLIIFMFVLMAVGFNIFFARSLPLAEGGILFLHTFAFFAVLLTLWIMTDHAPASQVFLQFKYVQTVPTAAIRADFGKRWWRLG
jgi:choline transport protein